jgi:hypothetical protein
LIFCLELWISKIAKAEGKAQCVKGQSAGIYPIKPICTEAYPAAISAH